MSGLYVFSSWFSKHKCSMFILVLSVHLCIKNFHACFELVPNTYVIMIFLYLSTQISQTSFMAYKLIVSSTIQIFCVKNQPN